MLRTLKYLLWLLLPIGAIHLLIVILRNKLYDWNVLDTSHLPRPVISVGNIQLGGTGKTPLTISILNKLRGDGAKVGILSRGYKRSTREDIIISKPEKGQERDLLRAIGDEPSVILDNLTNGTLGIGADRWRVGKTILEKTPIDVFLLDDGLQHRGLHRNLDICLIDVTRWEQHPFLFPFSYLRDCKSSLRRCHAVVLTKIGDQAVKAKKLRSKIAGRLGIRVFEGDLVPRALIRISDEAQISLSEMHGKKVAAFCGIARPDHFFDMLKESGMNLIFQMSYPDHHTYTSNDLDFLYKSSKQRKANCVFTTEKDAVKLKRLLQESSSDGAEFFSLKVEFAVKEASDFFELIERLTSSKSFN